MACPPLPPASSLHFSPSTSSSMELPACSHLAARALHARLLRRDEPDLSRRVLPLYVASGSLAPALSLLRLTPPEALSPFHFNTIIRAHSQSFLHEDSLRLFLLMQALAVEANHFTYPFVLKSCSALGHLRLASQIHATVLKSGLLLSNAFSAAALLDVYAKWAPLGDACKLFDGMPHRSSVAWNALISAFAQHGLYDDALALLQLMAEEEEAPISTSSWNSILAGCVRRDDVDSALHILSRMVLSTTPVAATFNTLLPVIPFTRSLRSLKELHCYALRHLHVSEIDVTDEQKLQSAIASGYATSGNLRYALPMFEQVRVKNTYLWNSIISGFVSQRRIRQAFAFFRRMVECYARGMKNLSKVSLTLLLPECDPQSKSGLEIHGYVYRHGLDGYASISNALIAMYARRGEVAKGRRVFSRAQEKDVVTWNTMVSSYALLLDYDTSFNLFLQMLRESVRPDEFSFGSLLDGCGHTSSLMLGRGLHCQIIKGGFSTANCVIQNAIMDMYSKCGCIKDARRIFDGIGSKDIISWNTIIWMYAFNACPDKAFLMFEKMKEDGWRPNRVTFVALLSVCSHAGLLEKGLHYFESMSKIHGIEPDLDHYTCIVDNLSRAGQLDCAYQLIKRMPIEPDDCIWGALLGGCRIHGNIPLAEIAGRHLMSLQPQHSGYRVLLSNVYADASRWKNVAQVWSAMKDDRIKKLPGCSWIELGNEVHKFFMADESHQQSDDIYMTLNILTMQLRDEGYLPSRISQDNFPDHESIAL